MGDYEVVKRPTTKRAASRFDEIAERAIQRAMLAAPVDEVLTGEALTTRLPNQSSHQGESASGGVGRTDAHGHKIQ